MIANLRYDAKLGQFFWNDGKRSGQRAGHVGPKGYRRVGRQYEHRLAWLMVHGELPPAGFDIDHINGDKADNRIGNLRLATRAENKHNVGKTCQNTSGHKGVRWVSRDQRWVAFLRINRKCTHLGTFADLPAAIAAHREAAIRHRGEFAFELRN